ncbi:MAG: hypothetical protein KAV99_07205, partial [Candidatus Latescibacteria bacterium]|nr:hypothetical protein [Candidatus Latescibacterota bacterium]
MSVSFDSTVKYKGPRADIATLTGSPLWGKTIGQVMNFLMGQGFCHRGAERLPTPYGLGPLVQHFESPSGRSVIRIPSYGGVKGEDWQLRNTAWKVFWLLWKAGVKVLIVGGTSGTADWRDREDSVWPGDFVLPWSFRTSPHHRGLPGTPYETSWPRYDLLLNSPFCPELAGILARKVRAEYCPKPFRRVHTPEEVRIALVVPDGITFETTFDILMWVSIAKRISRELQPELPPVVTLHGDCINPVLARLLGIHMLYYHLPSNWAQGLHPEKGITETLYPLYTEVFPEVVLQLEAWMLENLPIPSGEDCCCISDLRKAPDIF